jgi:arylsulfatase A-like enzyme
MPAAPRDQPISRALWAGALGGVLAGTGDVLASWGRLDQFLVDGGDKFGAVAHAAGLYGFAGAVGIALLAAFAVLVVRATPLGATLGLGRERRAAARAADPRRALGPLATSLVALPALVGCLTLAYRLGLHTITVRHHQGLIVLVAMAATLGAAVLAGVLTLLAGSLVKALLGLTGPRISLALSARAWPWVILLLQLALAAAYATWRWWETLQQLPLRPLVALTALGAGAALAWPLTPALLRALARLRPKPLRELAPGALVAALFALALLTGLHPGVRKATHAHTGLVGPTARALRWVVDFDRDGYSPLLGGGDCDDFSAEVYPGAPDPPDDDRDHNCSGPEGAASHPEADPRFVSVPDEVPPDFNVLLVTIDTLRADHLGVYGYSRPTTPALDALAEEGSVFVNSFAHAPSTRYSIPAILTGRHPSQVAWDESVWWPALAPENQTLAEVLKRRGLFTGALLNYSYFEPVRRMTQGFDVYDNAHASLHVGHDPASTRGSSSREQADAAKAFLAEHQKRRFFLWVHFYDPHYQYERHPGTHEFGPTKLDRYDHEIRFTDDQVARVFAQLKELGLWDKTVIVVTGDHGEGFGEHAIDLHGYHLYAPQTHVPLLIRVPGLEPRRVSMPVGHIDILPTLANLAGADPSPAMLGRSLVGVMSGRAPADADRTIFQEVSFEGPTERRAAVTQRWHLIFNRVPDNSWELYDRQNDPEGARDVWGSHDVAWLVAELNGWIEASSTPLDAEQKAERARLREPPKPQHVLDVLFEGAVRLVGCDVSPNPVRPGEDLTITWYWRSEAELDGHWGIFVHIEGPTRLVGDHDPAGGALPFSAWQPGEEIADTHLVRVPEDARPGEYPIRMGLWLRRTTRRAVAKGEGAPILDNRVEAARFTVLR